MKEKKCLTGYTGRRWHGDEFVQIEMENLDVLQGMFGTSGACVVSGCGLSYNSGTGYWTVAAGIVAMNHADGFKCARLSSFSFANAAPQVYLSILKTTNNKQYNDSSSHAFEDDYTATSGTSVPSGTENVDYLVVYRPAGIRTMRQAMGSNTDWVTLTPSTTSLFSANFKYRKNVLNNTLEIIGTATIDNTGFSNPGAQITIATLPSGFRPVSQEVNFAICNQVWLTSYSGTSLAGHMTGRIDTGGVFSVFAIKAGGGTLSYDLKFSVIIPLD